MSRMDSYYVTLFRVYLFVRNLLEGLYSITVKGARRALLLTHPQEYYFFSGYTTPYPAGSVQTIGPGVPLIGWTYNIETNVISTDVNLPLRPIPWLSASIRYNGLNLYSLDDFIAEVKYANTDGPPPPAVIVGSWSLYTGVVLDKKVDLELLVITEDGEERTLSPWSLDRNSQPLLLEAARPVFEPMTVEFVDDVRAVTLDEEGEGVEELDAFQEAT